MYQKVHKSTKTINEKMVPTIKFSRRGKKIKRFSNKTDNQGFGLQGMDGSRWALPNSP